MNEARLKEIESFLPTAVPILHWHPAEQHCLELINALREMKRVESRTRGVLRDCVGDYKSGFEAASYRIGVYKRTLERIREEIEANDRLLKEPVP